MFMFDLEQVCFTKQELEQYTYNTSGYAPKGPLFLGG